MKEPECMEIKADIVPKEFIGEKNLQEKIIDNCTSLKIIRGLCRLPQAGSLANELLKEILIKHGYYETTTTQELWKQPSDQPFSHS